MNKALLLIVCDFLLISILALVEFKVPEALEEMGQESVQLEEALGRDMVEVLRLSLENEARNRRELSEMLSSREEVLADLEQQLDHRSQELNLTIEEREALIEERARLEAEREQLARQQAQTQEVLRQTEAEREQLDASLKEREGQQQQLQAELQQRQRELAERESALEELEAARQEIEQERERTAMDLRIVQTERALLEENLTVARAEVERSRIEAERAAQRADRLGEGVSQLAERTSAVQEEIRQAQPVSMNNIYRRFEENRIPLSFSWTTPGLFGDREHSQTLQTILVEEGGAVYAMFESSRSPFQPATLDRLRSVRGTMRLGDQQLEIVEISFLQADPRVMAVAVPRRFIEGSGVEVFRLAEDPLRFPEAVLINEERGFFGESRFRLQPGSERYVTVDSRLFNRLFGEFSPRQGDVVFSKGGELIGFMISNGNSVLLREIRPWEQLRVGAGFEPGEVRRIQERMQGPSNPH